MTDSGVLPTNSSETTHVQLVLSCRALKLRIVLMSVRNTLVPKGFQFCSIFLLLLLLAAIAAPGKRKDL